MGRQLTNCNTYKHDVLAYMTRIITIYNYKGSSCPRGLTLFELDILIIILSYIVYVPLNLEMSYISLYVCRAQML